MEDMQMSGTPWIETPDMLHSSREYKCKFNTTEQCQFQQSYWLFWYQDDHRYALPTVAFFLTGIILFAIAYVWTKTAPQRWKQAKPTRKLTALTRFLSYRSFRISPLDWNSAPLGVLLLGAVGVIYFFSMTLGPKPYYWPNTKTVSYGDSPPLATRTGWMALACMPFVFATAGKSNLITAVTGVPHERLQVYHRWISYAFYILGLLHTFPFIVYHIWKEDMVMTWQTDPCYWTGVVALLAQTWLTFASFSPLRNLCYEFFKFTHFLAGLVFAVFLFIHCDFTLTSADYFIATGVLFSVSWLHSQLRVFFEHGIGTRARLTYTPNGFVKVTIPTRSTWVVGQHCFVRFLHPSMQPWSSHPFTICSLPRRGAFFDAKESEMVMYIRPRGGFTRALARLSQTQQDASVRVLLDGPYGGVNMQKVATSDRTVVIAGGSGSGFTLPFVESHLRRLELLQLKGKEGLDMNAPSTPSLRVVLATRDLTTRRWFESAVGELIADSSLSTAEKNISVDVHYTGDEASQSSPALKAQSPLETALDPEKAIDSNVLVESRSNSDMSASSGQPGSPGLKDGIVEVATGGPSFVRAGHFHARPTLPSLIAAEAEACQGRALAMFVCGPHSMQNDVANAAAAEQRRLMRSGDGDVYLHMEHFSWA